MFVGVTEWQNIRNYFPEALKEKLNAGQGYGQQVDEN